MRMTILLTTLAIVTCASAMAFADTKPPSAKPAPDEDVRYTRMYTDDIVNDDGTETSKVTVGMTVLREDAIEWVKQYELSYSTSAEKIDVVEAYTQKADGRRIDTPKNNFQITASGGRAGGAPAFSDRTSLTVIFPDVSVGDTVNLVYTKKVTDPLFPKQFDAWHQFSKRSLYDDVRIGYSIPLSLHARYQNFGLTETVNKQAQGRQFLAWTYKNDTVVKKEYPETPAWKPEDKPGVMISTFPSYRAIAESYGARAKPKASVTPEIQALADNITKGVTDRRLQAKALYDWEVANLTYAGNCIGIGAVVPRDLGFVLSNKMGDCKDHATLLQALLGAKGIASTQALIGVNSMYDLPAIPVVEIVNHVINYIPEFDLYVDATSGMPFGFLPKSLYRKPVLLVDGFREGSKTPARPPQSEKTAVSANVVIDQDGTADGTMSVSVTSPSVLSYVYQQRIRDMTAKKLDDAGKSLLRQSGYEGQVTVDKGVIDEKSMTYSNSLHFTLKGYVYPGTPGAIPLEPPFSPQTIGEAIAAIIGGKTQNGGEKVDYDFLCGDGTVDENYTYQFPPNLTVLAVPNPVSASTPVQTYTAEYKMDGKTMHIHRSLVDTSPAPVCPAKIDEDYRQLATRIWPDLKAQIVYK